MKKQWISLFAAVSLLAAVGCNSDKTNSDTEEGTSSVDASNADGAKAGESAEAIRTANYIELSSGKEIEMEVNTNTRVAKAKDNSKNVTYYVDPVSKDTVEAATGRVLNGAMVKSPEGKWKVDETKVKVEGDEMKVKVGEEEKLKVDGDDYKYKNGDDKTKSEKGEYKQKSGDTKVKVDDDEVKVKSKQ